MKVYIGYQVDYDYSEIWRVVTKVFDDEAKALVWKEEFKATEFEWRSYEEHEVE